METYVKLFGSILHSTVWQESKEIKLTWITLLAMSDKNGEIQASIPGVAYAAGVTVSEAEAAIKKFMLPDPYSRSTEFEGRRLEKIGGGWSLLNHQKYRDMTSDEQQRINNAERQRRFRERQKEKEKTLRDSDVTLRDSDVIITHTDTDTDTDTDTESTTKKQKKLQQPQPVSQKAAKTAQSDFSLSEPKRKLPKEKKEPKFNAVGIWIDNFKNYRHGLSPCLTAKEKGMLMSFCAMLDEATYRRMVKQFFQCPPDDAQRKNYPVWPFYERRNHYMAEVARLVDEERHPMTGVITGDTVIPDDPFLELIEKYTPRPESNGTSATK